MATEVVTSVDPGGAGDYSTLDAWEDDLGNTTDGDLVTQDEIAIAVCRSSDGSDDTSATTISGWTTGSGNYIEIRGTTYGGKTGDFPSDGIYDGTKYIIDTNGTQIAIVISEDYVYVRNIQILINQDDGNNCYGFYANGINEVEIDSIICKGGTIYGVGATGRAHMAYILSPTKISFYNCLMYDITGNSYYFSGIRIYSTSSSDYAYIYNCTAENCHTGFVSATNVVVNIINCIAANNTDDFNPGAGTTIDHCASDDGDGTNSQSPSGGAWTNEFNNLAGEDYSLKSGGNCVENGTNNPGSGLYSDDIIGTARS